MVGVTAFHIFTESSLAAKTLVLSKGLDNAFYIDTLNSEIVCSNSNNNILPIEDYFDNESLIDANQSTKFVNDHRLGIVISVVKK